MPDSFNGAATFQPRKLDAAVTKAVAAGGLQWGRDLSAAETGSRTSKARTVPQASMGPRPFSRGNDAEALQ